jgi:hypothetical protein
MKAHKKANNFFYHIHQNNRILMYVIDVCYLGVI